MRPAYVGRARVFPARAGIFMASTNAKKDGKTGKVTSGGSLGRVLLVEDDPILGLSMESALLDGGAREVVICPTVAATMDALESRAFDAVVLDVHLADRSDGWAVAELVSMLGAKKPRIVFSTGSPEAIPDDIKSMGPVFEKPYDPAALVEALSAGTKTGLFARIRGALR